MRTPKKLEEERRRNGRSGRGGKLKRHKHKGNTQTVCFILFHSLVPFDPALYCCRTGACMHPPLGADATLLWRHALGAAFCAISPWTPGGQNETDRLYRSLLCRSCGCYSGRAIHAWLHPHQTPRLLCGGPLSSPGFFLFDIVGQHITNNPAPV